MKIMELRLIGRVRRGLRLATNKPSFTPTHHILCKSSKVHPHRVFTSLNCHLADPANLATCLLSGGKANARLAKTVPNVASHVTKAQLPIRLFDRNLGAVKDVVLTNQGEFVVVHRWKDGRPKDVLANLANDISGDFIGCGQICG